MRSRHVREEVTVAKGRHELRLGKGVALVMGCLRRLRQENDTWGADFGQWAISVLIQ